MKGKWRGKFNRKKRENSIRFLGMEPKPLRCRRQSSLVVISHRRRHGAEETR